VHVVTTQANLLLPLYGVIVVAALALAWKLFGDGGPGRDLGPLAPPVAAFVAWDGLSLLWSKDVRQGAIELLFFVLPFGLLAVVLVVVIPWAGLLPSFSQSSFLALISALVVAGVAVWRRAGLLLVVAGLMALALAIAVSPAVRHKASLSHVTSGRSTLVSKGIKVAVHHPVAGVGVGGFRRAYAEVAHLRGKEPKAAASHTTPVTVAAETGLPGLLLFAWLVAAALRVAFRRHRGDFDGAARLAFGLALVAILVHCVFYNALFEDPTFWG